MRRREKRACQILLEASGRCDIIQSRKQTREKDMEPAKAQNQKMITKYTAPKTRKKDVAKTTKK